MITRISVVLEFPLSLRVIKARLGSFLSLAECEYLLSLCVPAVADFLDPITHGYANYTRVIEYLEDRGMSEDTALKNISEIERSITDEMLRSFTEVGRPDLYYEGTQYAERDAFVIHFTQKRD